MTTHITLQVDGQFSLAAAASFGFGPSTGSLLPDARIMRLAFVADDLRHHVGVALTQRPDGSLVAEVSGDAEIGAAAAQIRRILSIDTEVAGWVAAGQADPVLGAVQADNPGLRPVLFNSPYEAAAWSVLSQRRHRAQAMALHRRLCEAAGVTFDLAGQPKPAFPLPERLLEMTDFGGIEEARLARLHGVARAALDGQLEASGLRALPADEGMARLQRIKDLGPVYSMLVYIRSTGVTDALAVGEPRIASYVKHYYGLAGIPDAAELERIAEPWRPFRTWAGVLFRAAGDRVDLPFEHRPGGRPAQQPESPAGMDEIRRGAAPAGVVPLTVLLVRWRHGGAARGLPVSYRRTSSRALSVCVGCCADASLPAWALPRCANALIATNATATATAMPTVTTMAMRASFRVWKSILMAWSPRGS